MFPGRRQEFLSIRSVGNGTQSCPPLFLLLPLELSIVELQMLIFEGFAQRELFGMSDLKLIAQVVDSVKRLDGEVNTAINVTQIWKLNPHHFVHWCEMNRGICRDIELVQRPPRLVQPHIFLWPPDGVV